MELCDAINVKGKNGFFVILETQRYAQLWINNVLKLDSKISSIITYISGPNGVLKNKTY